MAKPAAASAAVAAGGGGIAGAYYAKSAGSSKGDLVAPSIENKKKLENIRDKLEDEGFTTLNTNKETDEHKELWILVGNSFLTKKASESSNIFSTLKEVI